MRNEDFSRQLKKKKQKERERENSHTSKYFCEEKETSVYGEKAEAILDQEPCACRPNPDDLRQHFSAAGT